MQFGNQCSFDWTVSSHYYCNEFISKWSYDVDRITGLRGTWSVWVTATRRPRPLLDTWRLGTEISKIHSACWSTIPHPGEEMRVVWRRSRWKIITLHLLCLPEHRSIAKDSTDCWLANLSKHVQMYFWSSRSQVYSCNNKLRFIFMFVFSSNSTTINALRPTRISDTTQNIAVRTRNRSTLLGVCSQKILPTLSLYIFKRFNSSLSLTRVVDNYQNLLPI